MTDELLGRQSAFDEARLLYWMIGEEAAIASTAMVSYCWAASPAHDSALLFLIGSVGASG
jgi:hypothetical protein